MGFGEIIAQPNQLQPNETKVVSTLFSYEPIIHHQKFLKDKKMSGSEATNGHKVFILTAKFPLSKLILDTYQLKQN